MDLAGPIENDSTQTRELNKQLYFVARFFRPRVLSAAAIRPKKEEEKGSASRIHQHTAPKWGYASRIHQTRNGGSPLDFIKIQPSKRGSVF